MKTIITTISIIILSFIIAQDGNAQIRKRTKKPQWIDYLQREQIFPKSTYIYGFASENNKSAEDTEEIFDRLKNHSRLQLSESILVTIKSITTSNVVVSNTITSEDFRKTSVSFSKIKVSGLKEETYYDEKEDEYFAITYAKKTEIADFYRKIIEKNKSRIKINTKQAKELSTAGKKQKALQKYYSCSPLIRETEEAQTIILALENKNATGLYFAEIKKYQAEIEAETERLQGSKDLSISDICFIMANVIKKQLPKEPKDIVIGSLTYQDSKMSGSFSKRFLDTYEQKLSATGLKPKRITGPIFMDENYLLSGTYWEEGEEIRIITLLKDISSGKTIGSAENKISKKRLKAKGIAYIPANYNKAEKKQNTLRQNDLISEGGLFAELTTNRGNNNPIFMKGDTLKLYLKTNKACYIRLIYHFTDGSKVLFLDNYKISNDMVNQLIKVPQEFECIAPFGIETLQLNAQTKMFAPLNVQTKQGIPFIIENTKQLIANVRGFKPITNKDAKAEKRIIITTLDN